MIQLSIVISDDSQPKQRLIRVERWVDGVMKEVFEQVYPLKHLSMPMADSLALRRMADFIKGMSYLKGDTNDNAN